MTGAHTASSVAARKRVLSGSLDQAPPHPSAPLNRQSVDMSNGQKRTRTVAPMLDLGTSAESQVTSVALSTPPASSSHASSQAIPDAALLYYLAVRAHHSAHLHLQQVFVPHRIRTDAEPGTAIPLNSNPTMSTAFEHDYQATDKALALLVMALDYLKLGLASRSLSDRERVAFGVEFAQVGLKVLRTLKTGRDEQRRSSKGKERSLEERVDAAGLSADLHDILSTTLCVAEGQDYLSEYRKKLETCNVQLAFADSKSKTAHRLAQQALERSSGDPLHRWTLISLLLECGDPAKSGVMMLQQMDELETIARQLQAEQLVQLAELARIRLLFRLRQWEHIQPALTSFSRHLDPPQPSKGQEPEPTAQPPLDLAWTTYIGAYFLLFEALFEGRRGYDLQAKAALGKAYSLMDEAEDHGYFKFWRATGGVIQIPVPSAGHLQTSLTIQLTLPNVLYQTVYLVTMVSRPEYAGTRESCRSLSHASAARQFASHAKCNDLWDTGFHLSHDVYAARDSQRRVIRIGLEIMLEEVTVLLFRSDFDRAETLLLQVIGESQQHGFFTLFFLHICLLFAMRYHLLGLTQAAAKYYQACKNSIQQGSEMELIFDIGLASCLGGMVGFEADPGKRAVLHELAKRCQASSSAALQAAGVFLDSLTDVERTVAKKKLTQAYELCQRSSNLPLKCLMFAFTTSVHLFGPVERTVKQLETGRAIAKSMGGKDREDGVGQASLGQFFAVKLKTHHRREQNENGLAEARAGIALHQARLRELRARKWNTGTSLTA